MKTCDWVPRFLADPEYGHLRLKRLASGYPPHDMDPGIIDVVEPEIFLTLEPLRMPFFLGTQFGTYPRLENLPKPHLGIMTIAVLGKSLLSGNVAGLSICEIDIGPNGFKSKRRIIRHFPNRLE
jgi:hypothetical protein